MEKSLRNILINSTLAFICAFFITTFIHESGHFFSYLIAGAHPVLYHNYVFTPEQQMSMMVKIVSALAGPVISLAQGIFSLIIIKSLRKNSIGKLLILWLSLLGFINFFGYLAMTPLSKAGDTGKVAALLNLGYAYRIFIAVIGILVLIFVVIKVGRKFSEFIPSDQTNISKQAYTYHIMFLPIIFGSIINTIFAFPIPVWLSVLYPATSAFVIMISFGAILKAKPDSRGSAALTKKISPMLFIILIIGAIINRLLTMGLNL